MYSPFYLSGRAVLYGNTAFLIVVLSTKNGYSSFFKKFFISKKTCFKVKGLKSFKTSRDSHINIWQSPGRRAILKTPGVFFRGTYVLSVFLKMKSLRRSVLIWCSSSFFFNTYFPLKFVKRSNRLFSVNLMNHLV